MRDIGGEKVGFTNKVAFSNLRAEMGREGITIQDIAKAIGIGRDAVSNKLSRKSPISLKEAVQIERMCFPGKGVHYLFSELDVTEDIHI